jgi:anti-anti-sigma regulatory factor
MKIQLIGRMRAEHLPELEKQIGESGTKVILDLEEVSLVDVDVVHFLASAKRKASLSSTARPTYRTGSTKSGIKGTGENRV